MTSRCISCNRIRFDHEMFCKHSRLRGHGKLRRVLLAYGRYDREVQYCQVWLYLLSSFDQNAQCLSTFGSSVPSHMYRCVHSGV
jgi:hypothetical protein